MNTPTPAPDPDLRPSATVGEALERLTATANRCVDELIAECRSLRTQRDELRTALKTILKGFEVGVFVRDVSGDGKSDYAVKLVPFIVALGKAQAAIARSEP